MVSSWIPAALRMPPGSRGHGHRALRTRTRLSPTTCTADICGADLGAGDFSNAVRRSHNLAARTPSRAAASFNSSISPAIPFAILIPPVVERLQYNAGLTRRLGVERVLAATGFAPSIHEVALDGSGYAGGGDHDLTLTPCAGYCLIFGAPRNKGLRVAEISRKTTESELPTADPGRDSGHVLAIGNDEHSERPVDCLRTAVFALHTARSAGEQQ